MLSLYQRLVLGCLLLIALVTGVSMLVRASFVQLAAVDASQQTADKALAKLAAVRAALAREELTAALLEGHASPAISSELVGQARGTQILIGAAVEVVREFDPSLPIAALESEHARFLAHMQENFGHLAAQLEKLNGE